MTINKTKSIAIDRDGVINKLGSPYVVNSNDLILINSSILAINILLILGFDVVVISNQSAVSKGLMSYSDLREIDELINSKLIRPIKFFYCIHCSDENCSCRKPKPGLFDLASAEFKKIECFIGDNITDYMAASAFNIDFCLVRTGHGNSFANELRGIVEIYDDLLECVVRKYLRRSQCNQVEAN